MLLFALLFRGLRVERADNKFTELLLGKPILFDDDDLVIKKQWKAKNTALEKTTNSNRVWKKTFEEVKPQIIN